MTQVFNPSSWEADAFGSLWVWEQSGATRASSRIDTKVTKRNPVSKKKVIWERKEVKTVKFHFLHHFLLRNKSKLNIYKYDIYYHIYIYIHEDRKCLFSQCILPLEGLHFQKIPMIRILSHIFFIIKEALVISNYTLLTKQVMTFNGMSNIIHLKIENVKC